MFPTHLEFGEHLLINVSYNTTFNHKMALKMSFFCARPSNNKTISWHYDARVKKEENKEANCKMYAKEMINSSLHQ